ncbi:glycoside hydrolase family 3 C-terminal domain-containing protein [Nonomuraea angiospora]
MRPLVHDPRERPHHQDSAAAHVGGQRGSVGVSEQEQVRRHDQGIAVQRGRRGYVVSPLDGLRAALPDAEITWTLGAVTQAGIAALPLARLTDPVSGEPGVRARFLADSGRELLSENRRSSDLARLGGSRPAGTTSVEVTTRYQVPEPGTVRLGVAGAGRATLTVNGALVLERELVHEGEDFGGGLVSPPHASALVELTAGEVELTARLDGVPQGNGLTLTLGEDPAADETDAIEAAVAAARRAEVAVIVVGTSPEIEREAADRATLALPGAQDALVRAVAAANPRTVVVVNAGAPVLMPWRDEVAAVLLGWFGGQEFGAALADVLLGTAEPGGRLPTTWPAAEADVPVLATAPVDGVVAYDEDIHIGYRAWLRAGAEPAYPFGHGLGYTSWEATGLTATSDEVSLTVRNTGERAGKQVVQVYLSRESSAVDRPARWLAGYAVVRAGAGEAERVTIPLARRAFQHWDGGWKTEPGEFTVHAGFSVTDLPLTARITGP